MDWGGERTGGGYFTYKVHVQVEHFLPSLGAIIRHHPSPCRLITIKKGKINRGIRNWGERFSSVRLGSVQIVCDVAASSR